MAILFDRIVVAVPDLPAAEDAYQRFFGVPPCHAKQPRQPSAAWWDVRNTVIELVPGTVERPHVQGIVFSSPDAGADERTVANTLGIDLRLCDGAATAALRGSRSATPAPGLSVDHIVLRARDAQACIDLFAGTLGIRLALDKTAPQWGGRMLFFRAGKLTLEVIASDEDRGEDTYFWGLAYACPDLDRRVQELTARGVSVSPVREGRKPGTSVATVKSHCLEIPTLLIQPAR